MPAKVFQVQSKDSVVKLGPFDTINAVQNLNLDPRFNEEYYSEMGNPDYSAQARQPETGGSFEVTATGSLASVLARMNYNYNTQAYAYSSTTKGNSYTFTETDMENMIFDLINQKQPGLTFSQATLIPNAQLTGITLRIDSTGTGSENYTFEAALQEEFYKPYHDMISVPLTTLTSGTAQIPAAFQANVTSGNYNIVYVFKDNVKFKGDFTNYLTPDATWINSTTIQVPAANFKTTAPFDRVVAVLCRYVPGTFPTIYYPTSARFVRGDRADIWLVASGTSTSDANRYLRIQSCEVNIPLTRAKLTEIKRNSDLTTVYYRALNYPLQITGNLSINENTLSQWAALQLNTATATTKVLNEAASNTIIDVNNVMNLVDFTGMTLIINYYLAGIDTTPLQTVTLSPAFVTSFSERQQVGGHAERTIGITGSAITIVGNTL